MTLPEQSKSETADSEAATQTFDVVIVGGGMVGASLSLLLDSYIKKGLKVALVDAHEISSQNVADVNMQQPSFDERTTAISLGSKRILTALGVWSGIGQSATAIEHIQVSQQKQFGRVRLHASECKVEALGYVVENKSIGCSLQAGILSQKKLTIFAQSNVEHYKVISTGVALQLRCADSKSITPIETRLLVLADGANSEGCRQLGIEQTKHDYKQHAIVCNVSFEQPHDQWAYERFTQQGPLALLPMGSNRYALVWCMDSEQAAERMACDVEQFKSELQSVVSYDKGRITQIGKRSQYPLALVQSSEQVRRHVVVLGNAAHALHPVAGQGFNLALRDAKSLAKTIGEQLDDPGNLSGLLEYVENQKQDQMLTTSISHLLPTQFSQPGLHWSALRSLAMTAMDAIPVSKQLFANQAMGLVGKASEWKP